MNEAEALATVSPAALAAASGVPEATTYRVCRQRRLPKRGPNAAPLREALERLHANPSAGTVDRKRAADIEKRALEVEQLRRRNAIESGLLVYRASVDTAHRTAGTEMRRGGEQMRRELAQLVPETHRAVFLAAFDSEWSRVRERVARALVVS